MNRRDFLKRLGLGVGVVALSPLLDLAPIEPAVEAVCCSEPYTIIIYSINMLCDSPRRLGVITGITGYDDE